jgi:predicted ATPase/class 3 adenylate cyclase
VRVSAAAAPSGVVTFLFTDIEGSTRRWEADPDGMHVALAAHDEVLRSAIDRHGGWLFKHTGDGICAAFASARSAVDAAMAAQRELELPVRMGLATGEAELRGADYFGAVLNRAARVMAAGHGGQILLAESTASLLSGIDLLDLGRRRLRDLPTAVGVFQAQAPGLRKDFPPLRAVDASPGNMRPQTTSFVGREAEVAEVQAALRAHRLVTLTGVGGVGKTRLAIEVATQRAGEFPDGVWLFELAAVTDPAAVPDAVATVLGAAQQSGKSMAESVAVALEDRVRLLVFDNCEHLRDATADLVETILACSPTVRILATSREGLGLSDEQLWPVPSLDVGSGTDSAAATLFVERARSVSPHFSLTYADAAAAVVEICRRLDGIPLAIELAASRMGSMTVSEVHDRLDHRFRLLVGSRRGLERHQTLRHAVAWSYDLLSNAEKALLERCSVFAGGFNLESAYAIAGFVQDDEYVVLDLLDALVRKSLLVADRSSGRTRFSMLETIRQFAEEQLVARGDATEVRTAHAHYFAGRETDILTLWDSPRQREAYEWFTAELANLRTAFRWAADHADLDIAGAIASYAGLFAYLLENNEPVAWAEELIEPARDVDHPRLADLYVVASLCWTMGRIDKAIEYAEASANTKHSARELAFGLDGLPGGVYVLTGQHEQCIEWYRAYFATSRDNRTLARSCLVFALVMAGSHDEAMATADGLIGAAEASENPWELSYALLAYGFALLDANPVGALDALRRGWVIAQDNGIRCNESYLATNLARLEAIHGDQVAALDYLTLTIDNYRQSANIPAMLSPLAILAAFLHRLGRHEPAATIAGHAAAPLTVGGIFELGNAIAGLRDVLGEQTYESLARKGAAMTNTAMVTYAYDQIDQARTELEQRRADS